MRRGPGGSAAVCAITSVMALSLLAGCGEKAGERKAEADGALAAPTTDALWALAPPDLRIGAVLADGAVGRARGALVTMEDLLERSLVTEPFARELRAALTFSGISLLDAKPSDIGVDLGRGAAFFAGEAGPVMVLPVVDPARLIAATRGESQGGVDRLGRDLFCKKISSLYVCASWAGQLDTLGRAATSPVAGWDAELRGDIEVYIAAPPAEVDELLNPAGLRGVRGIRIGARLERGAITIRAHVRGVLDGPIEQARTPEVPRLLAAADRAPAGLFAVKGAGLWRAFGEHLVAELPARILPGDVTLREVVASLDGDMVGWATPGERYTVLIGLATEGPMRRLLAACEQLAPMLADVVGIAKKGDRCTVTMRPDPTITMSPATDQAELWLQPGALRIEGTGARGAAAAPPQQPVPAPPAPAFRTEVADRPALLATWGHGSFIGARDVASPVELGAMAQGDAARLALRWLYFVNELGFALRVQDDGVHAALRVRTLWANPDPVIAEMQDVIEQLVDRRPEARARMAALAARFPGSPLADDLRASDGGLTVQSLPFLTLGALGVWAIERYAEKQRAIERGLGRRPR